MRTAAVLPILLTLASATPLRKRQDAPAPDSEDGDFRNNYHGSQLCEVAASNGTDDSAAVADAVNRCKSDATIMFTPGTEYMLAQPVRFQDLSNVEVRAWGNIHLPAMQEVQQAMQQLNGSDVPWIFVSGDQVVWRGSEKHDAGWVYGNGMEWYSSSSGGGKATTGGQGGPSNTTSSSAQAAPTAAGNSTSGGNQTTPSSGGNSTSSSQSTQQIPPNLFAWHLSNSEVHNLKIAHPPALAAYVAVYNATFSNFTVDASVNGSSANNAGGFHLEGDSVTLQTGAVFVGGPSVAVRNNASNVAIEGVLLAGGQAAMAIDGAEGSSVQNVSFSDITVVDTQQGSRISGPAGSLQEVSFSNIDVHNVSLPISVDNGGNSTLDLDSIVWEDWRGNMGANGTTVAAFNCGEGRCRNFEVEGINIMTAAGESPEIKCQGIDNSTSPDFGIQCSDGPLTELPAGSGVGGATGGAGGNTTQSGGAGGNVTQPTGGAGGNATQPIGGAGGNATQPSGGAGGNATQPSGGSVGGGGVTGGASSPVPPLATASGAHSSAAPSSAAPSASGSAASSAQPSGSEAASSSAAPSGSLSAASSSAQASGSSAAPSSSEASNVPSAVPSASESSGAPSGSESAASSSVAPVPSDAAASSSAPAPSSEAPQSSQAPPSSAPPPGSASGPARSQSQ